MPRAKPIEPWCGNGYSVRLTASQRVTLARLGGGQWLRDQIDKENVDKVKPYKPVNFSDVVNSFNVQSTGVHRHDAQAEQ